MKCPICGYESATKLSDRSFEQLRRYFALIRAAYFHWPETHKEQFDDETSFRKYLQMRAGAREVAAKIDLEGLSKEQALLIAEAAIRATGAYAAPRIHGNTLVIFRPKSIAIYKMAAMNSKEFSELKDKVQDIIVSETGVDAVTLLRDDQHAKQ